MSSLQAINAAILDAFTEDDLRQLVKFNLDVDLSSIADGGNLRSVVFAVTDWAQRNGRLPDLVEAAKKSTTNPLVLKLSSPVERSTRIYSGSVADVDTSYLKFQNEHLEKQIDKLERIVTGEDGISGIRQICLDNKHSIDTLISRSNNGPNLLAQKSSRYIFVALFVFLLLILAVSSGALSSFGIG